MSGYSGNPLLPTVLATALLGAACGPAPMELRVNEARRKRARESEDRRRAARVRQEAREAAQREKERRAREIVDQINAGIDPTNGRPLSRQQRRAIARKGYYA